MMKMNKCLAVSLAMLGLSSFATPSVEITNVSLADACDGKVNYSYTLSGDFEGKEYDLLVKVSAANGTKSTVVTHESVAAGTVNTNVDVKALLGKAYPNVAFFAELRELGGVEPVVEITKAWQANPGSGVIDFTYEVRDVEGVACDLIYRIEAKGYSQSLVFTNANVRAGSATISVNYKDFFGKASPNVSVYASLEKRQLGGVQLWAGGPIFAECNLGATKPEEYGYYFWWGDIVGYVYNETEHRYDSADGSVTGFEFSAANCPTSGKTVWELQTAGWCDNSGVLKLEHDAARQQLGASWRLPTQAECQDLCTYCDYEWVTDRNGTGIAGMLIKGRGDFAGKSIFLPGAGVVLDSTLPPSSINQYSDLYASMPDSSVTAGAGRLYIGMTYVGYGTDGLRSSGCSIRPVRDAE